MTQGLQGQSRCFVPFPSLGSHHPVLQSRVIRFPSLPLSTSRSKVRGRGCQHIRVLQRRELLMQGMPEHGTDSESQGPEDGMWSASSAQAASFSSRPSSQQRAMGLVSMAALAIAVCYADRANIADAIIPMTKEMGWSKGEEGAILSTFFLGYATTQVAGGLLADRWGGKNVLAGAVFLWSASTMLTPAAAHLGLQPLVLMRFLMGVGEGPGFPAIHSMIARQVSYEQQSTAVAVVTASSYVGTLAAFWICPVVIQNSSWEQVFYLFGAAGLLWIPVWLLGKWGDEVTAPAQTDQFELQRCDQQADHQRQSDDDDEDLAEEARLVGERDVEERSAKADTRAAQDEELRETVQVMRGLLQHKPVWAILVAQYTSSWGLYGMLNWLPTLLSERYGVQLQDSAAMTSLPYLVQGVVGALAGVSADYLIRNGMRVKRCRQLMQGSGMLLPAALLALSASASSPEQASALLTAGLGLSALSLAGVSVSHLDIAPQRAGLLFGMGNFAATLGGFISVWATGWVAEATGTWGSVLAVISAHYVVGAILWLAWVDDQDVLQ